MRSLLSMLVLAALLVAEPAPAAGWLTACLVRLGLVRAPVSRPEALPPWDAQAPPRGDLPLGEKPALPVSDFFEVVALVPDPQVPGRYLYRVRRKPGSDPAKAGLEGGQTFEKLVQLYPEFAARYGVRFVTVGGVEYLEYPQMEGINERLKGEPKAVKFWRDTGSEDTDHLRIARAFVARREMVLSLKAPIEPAAHEPGVKRSYHFHDMFVHLLGFEAIPTEYIDATQRRLEKLLRIYDDPLFRNARLLRERVAHMIREEVSQLDTASAALQSQLAKIPPPPAKFDSINVMLAIARLGRDSSHFLDTLQGGNDTRIGLGGAQWRRLEAHLKDPVPPVPSNASADADALVARFQAMLARPR